MAENENTAAPVETSSTPEVQSEETQQVESQSIEQVDTPQIESKVSTEMAIEKKEESETSSDTQMTLDDIVEEALNGELSEETKAQLSEGDLKHIDLLVAGHAALQEKNNQEIFNVVGGEDSYSELQEWGRNNMDEGQLKTFNLALFSGDMNLAKLAVQGLQAQYVAANGKSPDRVIEGGGTVNTADRPFNNVDEYLLEARSIDYKRNPDHRAAVEARRNKSGF